MIHKLRQCNIKSDEVQILAVTTYFFAFSISIRLLFNDKAGDHDKSALAGPVLGPSYADDCLLRWSGRSCR